MIAYNTTTYVWSWKVKKATPSNKNQAIAWMEGLPAIESHCLLPAALTTLQIANTARSGEKRMLFLGNRPPFCWDGTGGGWPGDGYDQQCLTQITAANSDNIPLDTIFYPEFPGAGEETFWQQLAAANQGPFELAE